MTEKQIYKAAKEWATKHLDAIHGSQDMDDIAMVFSAGAHSRDEEIEQLKEEIESLKENEKELFEGFKKRGTKLGELMKENVKLRNPN